MTQNSTTQPQHCPSVAAMPPLAPIKRLLPLACALGILSMCPQASSHEEPTETGWCQYGQVQILGQFTFNQKLLQIYQEPTSQVCNQAKTCGEFDDYKLARNVADNLCASYNDAELKGSTNGDYGTIRAVFHQPASFKNSEAAHHQLYSISQGLVFSCARCVAWQATPKVEEK